MLFIAGTSCSAGIIEQPEPLRHPWHERAWHDWRSAGCQVLVLRNGVELIMLGVSCGGGGSGGLDGGERSVGAGCAGRNPTSWSRMYSIGMLRRFPKRAVNRAITWPGRSLFMISRSRLTSAVIAYSTDSGRLRISRIRWPWRESTYKPHLSISGRINVPRPPTRGVVVVVSNSKFVT